MHEPMVSPGAGHTAGPAWLVIRREPQEGESFLLGETVASLGRHAGCALVLEHVTVSRCHAEIQLAAGQYVLVDGGSLLGTCLNRMPVTRAVLHEGDEIGVGVFRLVFHAEGHEAGTAPDAGGRATGRLQRGGSNDSAWTVSSSRSQEA